MQHWGDVSVNKQEDEKIIKNTILWSSNISESWDKNKIEM